MKHNIWKLFIIWSGNPGYYFCDCMVTSIMFYQKLLCFHGNPWRKTT